MKKLLIILIAAQIALFSWAMVPSIKKLNLDEKIGQLIIAATTSNTALNAEFIKKSPYNLDPMHVEEMVEKYHIGGIVFLGAGVPFEQVNLTNKLQQKSLVPLLIAQDAEWGLSMRLIEDVITYPKAMTLGALIESDDTSIYQIGREIGQQCKAIGVHCALAPVADVNSNPENPIINMRSFGETAHLVAKKAILFSRGLQEAGIISCAKHFPGHGDTNIDSHQQLPIVTHQKERLEAVELVPFKRLIKKGVDIIMTAHLAVPAFETNTQPLVPVTISHNIVTNLLRNELKFDGIIMTDGLGMKAVADLFPPGELELRALQAGHDLLVCPIDIPRAIERIKQAVLQGELSEKELDEHVIRILSLKRKFCNPRTIQYQKDILLSPEALHLKEWAYRAAITLVHDDQRNLSKLKNYSPILVFSNSQDCNSVFITTLQQNMAIKYCHLPPDASLIMYEQAIQRAEQYPIVIACVHVPGRCGMIEQWGETNDNGKITASRYISLVNSLGEKAIIILFGSPYNLRKHFNNSNSTMIVAYEDEPEAQTAAAAIITGSHSPRGSLPITAYVNHELPRYPKP